MKIWLGVDQPRALALTGRLGDGWIPSFIAPEQLRTGIQTTLEHAEKSGRDFEIDHFGALMYFCLDDDPAAADALARPYIPPGRANAETLARCTAFGPPALVRERLEEYVEAGGSKFVLRPMCPPDRMMAQLARLAEEVVPDFQRRR